MSKTPVPVDCDELFFLVEMPLDELPYSVFLYDMKLMCKFRHLEDAQAYMDGAMFDPTLFRD